MTRELMRRTPAQMRRDVARWNTANAPGAKVRFWRGLREGEPREGVTSSEAMLLGGHTAGVYVEPGGFVALTHVEAAEAATEES